MNTIVLKGRIQFDPNNKTRKHSRQSDWKRIAMVVFDDEMSEYYAWFIQRRYSIKLNKPIRGSHVTFLNDSINDIGNLDLWGNVKEKWDGKEIEVTLNLDVRTNGDHWWLKCESDFFTIIRSELGLGDPYFNPHLTIGLVNEKFIDHSNYIHRLLDNGLTY